MGVDFLNQSIGIDKNNTFQLKFVDNTFQLKLLNNTLQLKFFIGSIDRY